MRVLITGLPLFSKRLAEDLQAFDPENKYLFYDTYYSKWGKIGFLLQLPFCSHVISLNGVSDKSGILDWVLRLKKKLILQWMGTDSLLAMERYRNKTIDRKYIDYGINLVDSQWLEDELKSIELNPVWLDFKYPTIEKKPVTVYTNMVAVSYIAEHRQVFYGIEWIKLAAESFPDIQFLVFGMSNPEIVCPENVKFLGWQPSEVFMEAVRNAPIFLRLTEHDGFSVSVIEALHTGAEVLCTLPSSGFTHMVKDKSELKTVLTTAMEKVEARGMKPNPDIVERSQIRWNKARIMKEYIQFLKSL